MIRQVLLIAAGLALAFPTAAQDGETVYMGIDLSGEVAPEQRTVEAEMLAVLETGVELGCLSFEPPATYSQIPNDSEECREYMPRLIAASEGQGSAEGTGETVDDARANTLASIPLVQLARAAQSGNKHAQLELGMRFEEGRGGVEVNWENALELYTEAGRATPARYGYGTNPDAEAGAGGSVGRRQLSPRIPGLQEARERRDALIERVQSPDRD